MRIRLTNGIWIGSAVSILKGSIIFGMLIAATIEVITVFLINILWFAKGYKPLVPGSFMASIILPNTSPKEDSFSYQGVLLRIYVRAIALIFMALWPSTWPIFLIIFTLTILYK
jgi:hypothetical protein